MYSVCSSCMYFSNRLFILLKFFYYAGLDSFLFNRIYSYIHLFLELQRSLIWTFSIGYLYGILLKFSLSDFPLQRWPLPSQKGEKRKWPCLPKLVLWHVLHLALELLEGPHVMFSALLGMHWIWFSTHCLAFMRSGFSPINGSFLGEAGFTTPQMTYSQLVPHPFSCPTGVPVWLSTVLPPLVKISTCISAGITGVKSDLYHNVSLLGFVFLVLHICPYTLARLWFPPMTHLTSC